VPKEFLWKICTILALQWLLLRNYIVCLAVVWAEGKIHWCKIYASWSLNICHSADGKTKTEFFSGIVSFDVIGWNEIKWNGMEWYGMWFHCLDFQKKWMEWSSMECDSFHPISSSSLIFLPLQFEIYRMEPTLLTLLITNYPYCTTTTFIYCLMKL